MRAHAGHLGEDVDRAMRSRRCDSTTFEPECDSGSLKASRRPRRSSRAPARSLAPRPRRRSNGPAAVARPATTGAASGSTAVASRGLRGVDIGQPADEARRPGRPLEQIVEVGARPRGSRRCRAPRRRPGSPPRRAVAGAAQKGRRPACAQPASWIRPQATARSGRRPGYHGGQAQRVRATPAIRRRLAARAGHVGLEQHLARGLRAGARAPSRRAARRRGSRARRSPRCGADARHALLEQHPLDQLGLGLVAPAGHAHQLALGVARVDLARALVRVAVGGVSTGSRPT